MKSLMRSVLRDLGMGRRLRKTRTTVDKDMVFARHLSPGVTETATVTEVTNDGSGNPHIRFNVSVRDQHGTYNEGNRVLAMASFLENYRRVS